MFPKSIKCYFSLILLLLISYASSSQDCILDTSISLHTVDDSDINNCVFDLDICAITPNAPKPKSIKYIIDFDSNGDGLLNEHLEYNYDPPGLLIHEGEYCLSSIFSVFKITLPCNQNIQITVLGKLSNGGGSTCNEFITNMSARDTIYNFLPVELVMFQGYKYERDILLKWETASESNFSHFEIQRTHKSHEAFKTIGRIEGTGNNSEHSYYLYSDPRYNDENYYRLKMVDIDGSYEFSNIVFIDFYKNGEIKQLDIYPNPIISNNLNISLKLAEEEEITVIVFNISGILVSSKSMNLEEGRQRFTIDTEDLISGNYFLNIITKGEIITDTFQVYNE